MILTYDSFYEGLLIDYMINESIIYFSPQLKSILVNMRDNPIAKDFYSLEGKDVKPDVTFLDIDKEGYLSFISSRNAQNMITNKFPGFPNLVTTDPSISIANTIWDWDSQNGDVGITSKSRSIIKIGRLINNVFPNKYKDKEIEEFVNLFKSTIESKGEKLILVEGEDIDKWYSSIYYKNLSGTLGNSCMSNVSGEGILDIYAKNPEVCKMLILVEDSKLIGRALVWKVTSKNGEKLEFDWFLDRQYVLEDSDIFKFRRYAKSKGWAYKTQNNHHSLKKVTYMDNNLEIDMSVQLGKSDDGTFEYHKYPYLDTFRMYKSSDGKLYNYNDDSKPGFYILDHTDGTFTNTDDKYSEYYDTFIPKDRALWCENISDWIYKDQTVEVTRGKRKGIYPDGYNDICFDSLFDDYIHVGSACYSDYHQSYILESKSIKVIRYFNDSLSYCRFHYVYNPEYLHDESWNSEKYVKKEKYEDMKWYQYIYNNDTYIDDCDGIFNSLLMKGSDGNWIPVKFKIKLFKTEDNEYGIEYLSGLDSSILGMKVLDDYIISDVVDYNTKLYNNKKFFKVLLRGYETYRKTSPFLKFGESEDMYRTSSVQDRLYYLNGKRFILLES